MENINVSSIVSSTFHIFSHNKSYVIPGVYDIDILDAAWIIPAALIFFTMQTGLALLEAGIVSKKNEVNVMMKKIVDISFIGIAYWIFGFALMHGRGEFSTPFFGFGDFFVSIDAEDKLSEQVLTFFFFQISFASTATTIASGGAAERFRFSAYTIYCFLSCLIYSIGAGWIWGWFDFDAYLICIILNIMNLY
jgi:Amt family ammonium transporter